MKQVNQRWTEITTFAQLDKSYAKLLERITFFQRNASKKSFPQNTLELFSKELETYIQLVKEEKKEVKKLLKESQKNKQKDLSGILKIQFQKIQLVEKNLSGTYQNREKNLEKKMSNKIKKTKSKKFNSSKEILQNKKLAEKFSSLFDEYQSLQTWFIEVKLADTEEKRIEKKDTFLLIEIDYLTQVNNILYKAKEREKQKDHICTWSLTTLKKTRQSWFERSSYEIQSLNNKDEAFIQDWKKHKSLAKNRIKKAKEIKKTIEAYHFLQTHKLSKAQFGKIEKKIRTSANNNQNINAIFQNIEKLELTYQITFHKKIIEAIESQPFSQYAQELYKKRNEPKLVWLIEKSFKLLEKYTEILQKLHEIILLPRIAGTYQRKIKPKLKSILQWVSEIESKLIHPSQFLPKKSWPYEEILNEYSSHLTQLKRKTQMLKKFKANIVKDIIHIEESLHNVKNYTYKPFDTLNNIIRHEILLSKETEFQDIREDLIKKLEKSYTEQYQYLLHFVPETWWNKKSWSSLIEGLINSLWESWGKWWWSSWKNRSIWGGSSFSSSRWSSWWTSW